MSQPDPDLIALYGLETVEQQAEYYAIAAIVDEALDQFDKGFAVDVERLIAEHVKRRQP